MSSIFGPEGVSLIPRPFLIIRRTAGDGKREGKERREGSGEWASETLVCNGRCNCIAAKWVPNYSHHGYVIKLCIKNV